MIQPVKFDFELQSKIILHLRKGDTKSLTPPAGNVCQFFHLSHCDFVNWNLSLDKYWRTSILNRHFECWRNTLQTQAACLCVLYLCCDFSIIHNDDRCSLDWSETLMQSYGQAFECPGICGTFSISIQMQEHWFNFPLKLMLINYQQGVTVWQ